MQQLLSTVLEARGHEVTTCTDAETAWELCQSTIHKLIVLDYMLPGMDGLQLCRQIRSLAHGDRSIILVFTGCDQPDDLRAVLAAGADDYLAKSSDLALLEVRLAIAEQQVRILTERKQTEDALCEARVQEVEIGAKIQQTLLFNQPPQHIPGIDVVALTIPSQEIDGDFYDFMHHDNILDMMIGDVMGKGVPAALLGAAIKTQFLRASSRLLISSDHAKLPEPKEIVTQVQQEMVQQLIELESFATICYARFDLLTQHLHFVDCGHTKTIHFQARTGACKLLKGDNVPLGFSAKETYEQTKVSFEPGDLFIYYSDGLTETQNEMGECFGEERLAECVLFHKALDPGTLVRTICSTVHKFANEGQIKDDLTCIVIKAVPVISESEVITHADITIPSELSQLRDVRNFVRQSCLRHQVRLISEDTIDQLELAVCEATTNIVNHAHDGCQSESILVEIDLLLDRIIIELSHRGKTFDPAIIDPPDFDGFRDNGFGLYIINQLVDEVYYQSDQNGNHKTVLIKNLTNDN